MSVSVCVCACVRACVRACVCVCVCVCVSVRDHIFGFTRPIFAKFLVRVTYGRGSVLLGGVVIRYILLDCLPILLNIFVFPVLDFSFFPDFLVVGSVRQIKPTYASL